MNASSTRPKKAPEPAGRRHIGHIAGPDRFLAARKRANGFCDAITGSGVARGGSPEEVLYGEWSESWGRQATRILLRHMPEADGIFCGSDQIARGVCDTLRLLGRRIPDDVAVMGFDNWEPMALGCAPPLTSIDMCLENVGRVAAQHLLAAINGEPSHGVHTLPCGPVVRESTGGAGVTGTQTSGRAAPTEAAVRSSIST